MLFPMLVMLIGPYVLISAIERVIRKDIASRSVKGRLGITLFLLGPAFSHFISAEAMIPMLPPWVPLRLEIIYVTGVFEFAGAIGIWIPRLQRLAGAALILMLLCFLPANIYAAINYVDYGGSDAGPQYLLVRVPFQFVVMWWVYWSTEQTWFKRRTPTMKETQL